MSSFHHQQTLQNLVDPMNNDVTVLQSDYQRIKKHTPTYQADFAGIFPNLLTNTISNTFDSDEEETLSSGTFIRLIYPRFKIQMLLTKQSAYKDANNRSFPGTFKYLNII